MDVGAKLENNPPIGLHGMTLETANCIRTIRALWLGPCENASLTRRWRGHIRFHFKDFPSCRDSTYLDFLETEED